MAEQVSLLKLTSQGGSSHISYLKKFGCLEFFSMLESTNSNSEIKEECGNLLKILVREGIETAKTEISVTEVSDQSVMNSSINMRDTKFTNEYGS